MEAQYLAELDTDSEEVPGLSEQQKVLHTKWKCWVPPTEQKDFQLLVQELEQIIPR